MVKPKRQEKSRKRLKPYQVSSENAKKTLSKSPNIQFGSYLPPWSQHHAPSCAFLCKRTGRARGNSLRHCSGFLASSSASFLVSAFSSETPNLTARPALDFEQHGHRLRCAEESPSQTVWRRAFGAWHEGRLAAMSRCQPLLACLHLSEADLHKFPFFFS